MRGQVRGWARWTVRFVIVEVVLFLVSGILAVGYGITPDKTVNALFGDTGVLWLQQAPDFLTSDPIRLVIAIIGVAGIGFAVYLGVKHRPQVLAEAEPVSAGVVGDEKSSVRDVQSDALSADSQVDLNRDNANSGGSAATPDMNMSEAVRLAAGEHALDLGHDLDRLAVALTRIRQLAYQGKIQVWGKEITDQQGTSYSDIWTVIPRRFWARKELLPVVMDAPYTGPHTIIDGAFSQTKDTHPDYTSTRVNRKQFEGVVANDDPGALRVILGRYLEQGWDLFNRVGKKAPNYRIVNLDGQTQHEILEWNRKVEQILEGSGAHKAKRDFMYYKLESTGELRVRVARLQQILENELGQS